MNTNDVIQWIGAVFIIAGHSLNAAGPAVYPFNIIAFFIGTVFFLIWAIKMRNQPQLLVNVVAIGIGAMGLYRAI